MKSFSDWLRENNDEMPLGGSPMMKNSDMAQADDTKLNSFADIGRRAAEKYSSKFLDAMWRIARDTEDDELQEMLSQVDSKHGPHKKSGFGMEDEMDGLNHGNKDVVPNSADHGMGDSDLE
tara:strand:+ start:13721 stop:14083 length:363 start_codon:yes stop_codon:yes gene_type:complete